MILYDIWVMFDIFGGVGFILYFVVLSWDRFCVIVWFLKY